jgi:hypothetical protein
MAVPAVLLAGTLEEIDTKAANKCKMLTAGRQL